MEYLRWDEGRTRAINDTLGLYGSEGNVDEKYVGQHLSSEDMESVRRWVALTTENTVLVEGVVKRLYLIASSGSIQLETTEEALLRSSGTNSDTLAPETPPVRYTNRHQKTNSTAVSMAHVTNLLGLWETPQERRMEGAWASVKTPPPISDDTVYASRYLHGSYSATTENNDNGGTPTDDNKGYLEKAVGAVKFLVDLQRNEQGKLYTVIGSDINKFIAACYDLRTLLPGQLACRWNIQHPTHATLFRALNDVLNNSAKYRAWLPRTMVMDTSTPIRTTPALVDDTTGDTEDRRVSVVEAEIVTRLMPKKEVLAKAMGLSIQLASNALLLSHGPGGMNGGMVPIVHLSGHDRTSALAVSVDHVSPGKAYDIFGLVRPEVSYAETISPQYMSDLRRRRDVYLWKNTFAREVRASNNRLQDLPRWLILDQRAKVMRQSQIFALKGNLANMPEYRDASDMPVIQQQPTTNSPGESTTSQVCTIEKLSLVEVVEEESLDQFSPKNIVRAPNIQDMKHKSRTIRDTTQSSFLETKGDEGCRRVEEDPSGSNGVVYTTQETRDRFETNNDQSVKNPTRGTDSCVNSSWTSVIRQTVKSTPVPRTGRSALRARKYLSDDDDDDDDNGNDTYGDEGDVAGGFW